MPSPTDDKLQRQNELRQSIKTDRDTSLDEALKARITLPSVAIQRLIDEVGVDKPATGYNRTYHRHNR